MLQQAATAVSTNSSSAGGDAAVAPAVAVAAGQSKARRGSASDLFKGQTGATVAGHLHNRFVFMVSETMLSARYEHTSIAIYDTQCIVYLILSTQWACCE
jgi:hypothetical protein